MSDFIVIWLLVVIENISMMLASAGAWFPTLLFLVVIFTLAPNILSSNKEKAGEVQDRIKNPRKWLIVLTACSLFLGAVGTLLPSKSELAIIIGAGATYKILASDEAREIGGKSIELINLKLDEWTRDVVTPVNDATVEDQEVAE